jgi:hypothetical protein
MAMIVTGSHTRTRCRDDESDHRLAPLVVAGAHDADLAYLGMLQQALLHL